MRFIVTCSGESLPSNTAIKRALKELGLTEVSIAWINSEGLSDEAKLASVQNVD